MPSETVTSGPIRVDATVPLHKKGVASVDSQVDNRTYLYRANMANRDPKDEGDMGVLPMSAPDVNSKLDMIVRPGTLKVVPCQTDEAMVHETKGDPSYGVVTAK